MSVNVSEEKGEGLTLPAPKHQASSLKRRHYCSLLHIAASNSNKGNRYTFVVHAEIFTNPHSSAKTYTTKKMNESTFSNQQYS